MCIDHITYTFPSDKTITAYKVMRKHPDGNYLSLFYGAAKQDRRFYQIGQSYDAKECFIGFTPQEKVCGYHACESAEVCYDFIKNGTYKICGTIFNSAEFRGTEGKNYESICIMKVELAGNLVRGFAENCGHIDLLNIQVRGKHMKIIEEFTSQGKIFFGDKVVDASMEQC